MAKNKKIQKFLEETIANIRDDRSKASVLLKDAAEYIGASQERHREVGLTAAKYLEVLQRSNEQFVKIITLIKDDEDDEFGDLDEKEKEEFYEEFEVKK